MGPIAYITFLLLINSKGALGANRPEGTARVVWNILLLTATGLATLASIWALTAKPAPWGTVGMVLLGILALVGLGGYFRNRSSTA